MEGWEESISIIEFAFDWEGWEGIEGLPPSMSARRSALFWVPFMVALEFAAGRSEPPMRSKSMPCSVCFAGLLALAAAFFCLGVASLSTRCSSRISGGGMRSRTPRLMSPYAKRLPYSTALC